MITLYTTSVPKSRSLVGRSLILNLGATLLDTTMKSGIDLLAPEPRMVYGYKNGSITEKEYTLEYKLLILGRMKDTPDKFFDLFKDGCSYVLSCYCPSGCFCHRHLLSRLLRRFFKRYNIQVAIKHEL